MQRNGWSDTLDGTQLEEFFIQNMKILPFRAHHFKYKITKRDNSSIRRKNYPYKKPKINIKTLVEIEKKKKIKTQLKN